MSDGVSVKVEGVEEAIAKMASLEAKIKRRVVTKAIRAGGNVIVKAARQQAPSRSGSMRKAIRQSIKFDRRSGTVKGSVKIDRKKSYNTKWGTAIPGKYAHLIIAGTKAHEIKRAAARGLKIGDRYYGSVFHPGARDNDFMGRASRSASHPAINTFAEKYGREVDIEVSKL